MKKTRTRVAQVVAGLLLLIVLGLATLTGVSVPNQPAAHMIGAIPAAHADGCDGVHPPPDPDCPGDPTPTPTPPGS